MHFAVKEVDLPAGLKDRGRAEYVSITDVEAVKAYQTLSALEGIIPALESSHAIAYAMKAARKFPKKSAIVVCLSGRGDKDMEQVAAWLAARKR